MQEPVLINVSHPLWMTTSARIDNFNATLPEDAFKIPEGCAIPAAESFAHFAEKVR